MMEKADKIIHKILLVMAVIGGAFAVIMMFGKTFDVIGRNVFKSTIPGVYEMVQYYLMPNCFFLAIPAAYAEGLFPKVGDLLEKTPKSVQKIAAWSVFIGEIIMFGLLTYYTFQFTVEGFATKTTAAFGGSIRPLYWAYPCMPLGFGATLFMAFWMRIKNRKV